MLQHAKNSLRGWVIGVGVLILVLPGLLSNTVGHVLLDYWIYILIVYAFVALGATSVFFKEYAFKVAIRACSLGVAFTVGISLAWSTSSLSLCGWYIAALAIFHWSEYFTTAVTNPRHLALDSYLLNHSLAYHLAIVACVVEFTIEWYFFPDWKQPNLLSLVGLLLVAGGEVLRKLAMLTAGSNFNHYIRYYREDGHQLITHGIFNIFRHPSYVGWFYWSIGTQIMVLNPLCTIAYGAASWKFFRDRVTEEEITLLNFFGEEYLSYQQRVGTGLPFISGYRITV